MVKAGETFFTVQKLLTQWDKTFAWGHYESLMKCKEPKFRKSYAAVWMPENVKACITNKMPSSQQQEFSREKFMNLQYQAQSG